MKAMAECPTVYARLEVEEGRLCSEELDRHLVAVAEASVLLYSRLGFQGPLEPLALAAAVHDIGKVLHNVADAAKVRALKEGRASGRLSFQFHELLSAAVLGYYLWLYGDLSEEEAAVAVRAVAMHHQGLRGVSAETYHEGLAWLAARYAALTEEQRKLIADTMACILRSVAKRLSRLPARVADILESIANSIENGAVNPALSLEHATRLLPVWLKIGSTVPRYARIAAGMLMLADNAIARAALQPTCKAGASTYVSEALWLYQTLLRKERSKQQSKA